MAIAVSLINMKGGVGKSTVAVNLAWCYAGRKALRKRVLVVDLDPQFNASQYLIGLRAYEQLLLKNVPTIWDVFEHGTRTPTGTVAISNPRDAIHERVNFPSGGCIHLVPSRLELALSLKNPSRKENRLAQFLKQVDRDYDLILIDCAPTESVLTTAAYLCSQWLLVPVKPEYLSTIGLPLLVNSMQDFKQEHRNAKLQLAGVVFNAASNYLPEEALAKREVRQVARQNGWHVFRTGIEYSRSYPRGAREGLPISRTRYSRTKRIINFDRFALEFARRVGL